MLQKRFRPSATPCQSPPFQFYMSGVYESAPKAPKKAKFDAAPLWESAPPLECLLPNVEDDDSSSCDDKWFLRPRSQRREAVLDAFQEPLPQVLFFPVEDAEQEESELRMTLPARCKPVVISK